MVLMINNSFKNMVNFVIKFVGFLALNKDLLFLL